MFLSSLHGLCCFFSMDTTPPCSPLTVVLMKLMVNGTTEPFSMGRDGSGVRRSSSDMLLRPRPGMPSSWLPWAVESESSVIGMDALLIPVIPFLLHHLVEMSSASVPGIEEKIKLGVGLDFTWRMEYWKGPVLDDNTIPQGNMLIEIMVEHSSYCCSCHLT